MIDLTTGKESTQIFKFAMPMLLGNVFQQLYNIVDSIIVGNYLGKEALGAVGASFPIIFVLISFIVGLAMGSTVIISQYFGAKQYKNIQKSVDTIMISLMVASVLVTIIGLALSGFIFELLKLPAEIIPQAKVFFQVYVGGIIVFFGYNGVAAILRGLGDSKTPLVFLVISTVVNIILVVVFVIYFKWGIVGAAIATIIAQGGAFFTAIIYLNRTHEIIQIRLFNLTFDKEIFKKSLEIGLPSGLQHTFVALGMMALFRIVNEFGTDAVAAYSVAGRIDSFAMLPAMNFSAALSTFVGQNIGAQKPERVKKGFESTLLMTSIVSVTVTLSVIFFSRQFMGFFTNDTQVVEIGARYLIIVSSFYILFTTMFICAGVLRGAGDTIIPMFVTLISLWLIRIPVSWALSKHLGVEGIWWGIPIAWAIGAIFSYLYYRSGRWKKKSVIKHHTEAEQVEVAN